MVNLDKWEEVQYADIKKGDKVRVITKQGSVTNDTTGKADHSAYSGWASSDGVVFLSNPERFKPIVGGVRTIYRRKPKPFTLPTGLGAVIEAMKVSSGSKVKLILADSTTESLTWIVDGGSWYTSNEIANDSRFRDLTVLSEGLKDNAPS